MKEAAHESRCKLLANCLRLCHMTDDEWRQSGGGRVQPSFNLSQPATKPKPHQFHHENNEPNMVN